mmetsp:Transcript_4952/g.16349  ORF Transcript_4952/g.16349 Transcript_4952/m.16349 type:complete len:379 (+) Transcript_4952:389-1525(+)
MGGWAGQVQGPVEGAHHRTVPRHRRGGRGAPGIYGGLLLRADAAHWRLLLRRLYSWPHGGLHGHLDLFDHHAPLRRSRTPPAHTAHAPRPAPRRYLLHPRPTTAPACRPPSGTRLRPSGRLLRNGRRRRAGGAAYRGVLVANLAAPGRYRSARRATGWRLGGRGGQEPALLPLHSPCRTPTGAGCASHQAQRGRLAAPPVRRAADAHLPPLEGGHRPRQGPHLRPHLRAHRPAPLARLRAARLLAPLGAYCWIGHRHRHAAAAGRRRPVGDVAGAVAHGWPHRRRPHARRQPHRPGGDGPRHGAAPRRHHRRRLRGQHRLGRRRHDPVCAHAGHAQNKTRLHRPPVRAGVRGAARGQLDEGGGAFGGCRSPGAPGWQG